MFGPRVYGIEEGVDEDRERHGKDKREERSNKAEDEAPASKLTTLSSSDNHQGVGCVGMRG